VIRVYQCTLMSRWIIGGWRWWNWEIASQTSQNTRRMSFSLKPPSGCRSAISDISRPTPKKKQQKTSMTSHVQYAIPMHTRMHGNEHTTVCSTLTPVRRYQEQIRRYNEAEKICDNDTIFIFSVNFEMHNKLVFTANICSHKQPSCDSSLFTLCGD